MNLFCALQSAFNLTGFLSSPLALQLPTIQLRSFKFSALAAGGKQSVSVTEDIGHLPFSLTCTAVYRLMLAITPPRAKRAVPSSMATLSAGNLIVSTSISIGGP